MKSRNSQITGYILAGGKSSRMGTDKGLMQLNDKHLIEYSIEKLKAVFNKVVIVSNNPEYKKLGLEVIPDELLDIGPAGGIYTALAHSATTHNFITSCDMPFITPEAINFMISNLDSSIVIPNQGKLEPLFAVYATSCKTKWLQLVQQGIVKLQELITHFPCNRINIANHPLFNESFFMNINNREEFLRATRLTYDNDKSATA
jgi:molybdenum cofactor guanylyltransferase